jgi:hypothetical protein
MTQGICLTGKRIDADQIDDIMAGKSRSSAPKPAQGAVASF